MKSSHCSAAVDGIREMVQRRRSSAKNEQGVQRVAKRRTEHRKRKGGLEI